MKRIIVFFVLAFLSVVGLFAQTDFFYTANGKETFKVRKDRIVIRATPVENVNALSALSTHTALLSTHMVGYDMLIATIDTLNSTLEDLRQESNVADATFALEYADGTVQMPTNRIFVQFKEGQTPENVFNFLGLRESIKAIELINEFDGIYMITLNVRLDDILRICRDLFRSNLVVFAEPVFIREARRFNPLFPQQWGLRNTGQSGGTSGIDINAMQAWNITRGNSQIRVAVIDEGVDLMHLDLRDNLLPGFDATVNPPSGANGSPHANNAHGTLCAGVIAALDNNIGMVGVAPNVRIIPVRIAFDRFDNGSWTTQDSWIVNGIRHAWQTAQADVLNNSWGGGSQSATIDAEINAALTQGRSGRGSVVIFASGNDRASSVSYPASLPNVIAVGAIDRNGRRAGFSNFGTNLDVVAPGVGIITTSINNSYVTVDGTSLAAPHVSGIAALILSVRPDLTQAQVRHAIESTARKLPNYNFNVNRPNGTWNNQVGHGLVDAHAALRRVLPSAISGPTTICDQATFTIANLPQGATVQWFLPSNTTRLTSTNSSITVNRNTSQSTGFGLISATINLPHGSPIHLTKQVHVGPPNSQRTSTSHHFTFVDPGVPFIDAVNYPALHVSGAPLYGISIVEWRQVQNGNVVIHSFPPSLNIPNERVMVAANFPGSNTRAQLQVRLHNQCGPSPQWTTIEYLRYVPPPPPPPPVCPNCFGVGCFLCQMELPPGSCGMFPCRCHIAWGAIHPNPVDDVLTIDLIQKETDIHRAQTASEPIFDIRLLNAQGVVVRQQRAQTGQVQFDVSRLPEGTYYLHIEHNGEIEKHQIIINRN